MTKAYLRSKYKIIRRDTRFRGPLEESIFHRFTESELFRESESVFLYSSAGTEVSTQKIAALAFELGKKVAFPLCTDYDGNMDFYFVDGADDLTEGMYGIMEPDSTKCEKAEFSKDTLLVVPALAFDRRGYRLGYGKGYYDRFLDKFTGTSVGLCFEECICDFLPVNAYDKKVNYLISDKKTYIFNTTEEE